MSEKLAERFHEIYESCAHDHGYETRKASAVPWGSVPKKNKDLMIYVCSIIKKEFIDQPQPDVDGTMNCPHGPCICSHCKAGCPRCTIEELRAEVTEHRFQNDCSSGSEKCDCSEKNGYPCYRHIDHEYRKLFELNTKITAEVERLKKTGGFKTLRRNSKLAAQNKVLRVALSALYAKTKNDYTLCGINQQAKEALSVTRGDG